MTYVSLLCASMKVRSRHSAADTLTQAQVPFAVVDPDRANQAAQDLEMQVSPSLQVLRCAD